MSPTSVQLSTVGRVVESSVVGELDYTPLLRVVRRFSDHCRRGRLVSPERSVCVCCWREVKGARYISEQTAVAVSANVHRIITELREIQNSFTRFLHGTFLRNPFGLVGRRGYKSIGSKQCEES